MSELAKIESVQVTPMEMLNMAVSQGADVDKLEKLMNLQERWETNEAKKAFSEALALFQSKLGSIVKRREGHNCKYADIDDIAQQIRPILEECGMSYRFEQSQDENGITVTCILVHRSGHSERTSLTADPDKTGGKNDIQAMASAVTYLRRYSLTGVLGITTGQDDNDGGKPEITVEGLLLHNKIVCEEFFSIFALKDALANEDYSSAREAWAEISMESQGIIWRAPTKGGILTTDERKQMKSNEWSAA